jgi:hypothetical protein
MEQLKPFLEKAEPVLAQIRRQLARALWFALALVFLAESWLWDNVKEWLRALGKAVGVERFEPWLARLVAGLSPQMTLALFAIPMVAVLPAKLVGLSLVAQGHVVTGVVAILLIKTLTLGIEAFLFDICREKLLEMEWFGRFYSLVLDFRAWATMLVKPYKERALAYATRIRAYAASLLGKEGGDLHRRIARLRELARPKRSS